jgi:hypothetical protein
MSRLTAEETISDKQRRSSVGILRWCIVTIFTLPSLYVLSTGPVVRLCAAGIIPLSCVAIYSPLRTLVYRSGTFDKFLSWYMHDIWGGPVF